MKLKEKINNSLGLRGIEICIIFLLAIAFSIGSCKKTIEQEKITPVSREYAFNKVEEFCKQFKIDCEEAKLDTVLPDYFFIKLNNEYKALHLWDKDYFRGAHVICELQAVRRGSKDKFIHFLIRDKSKEVDLYGNIALLNFYKEKYWVVELKRLKWPEFIAEEKAKNIFNSIADKLQIPSDMVFDKVEKNEKEGVWNAGWLRKRNGYKYEGDAISMSIMGATGEFVAYTKTYRGVPCSTEMKISRDRAIEISWEKFKKYLTWKMKSIGEKGKDLYEVQAEPLIIQTGAFGKPGTPVVNIEGSKLAWVIEYNFTGGFERPKELLNKSHWTEGERKTFDTFYRAMDKKWRELGAPERHFEIRIDAATGKVLYTSPVRPWYVRWFGELSVKKLD